MTSMTYIIVQAVADLSGLKKIAQVKILEMSATVRATQFDHYYVPLISLQYSGTSKNGLPLLRKPPQCGQESAVPNYSLYYSICT